MKTNNVLFNFFLLFLIPLLLTSCDIVIEDVTLSEGVPLVMDAPQLVERPFQTARVVDVIDGDTIRVEIEGERFSVRYIGINTPERDELCFEEATKANADYVANQTVRLVWDESDTDRFGRLLRYVYVDDVLVNAELVAGGWAESRRYNPDTLLFDYMEGLEETAVRQRRGCQAQGVFD